VNDPDKRPTTRAAPRHRDARPSAPAVSGMPRARDCVFFNVTAGSLSWNRTAQGPPNQKHPIHKRHGARLAIYGVRLQRPIQRPSKCSSWRVGVCYLLSRCRVRDMLHERSRGHLAWAKGSLRTRRQAGDHQSARLSSVRRDGGRHRLQSRWLDRQPVDGLCRVPKTAALSVKAGAFRSDAVTMGLGARRFHSD
jgi:hypothetical protein